MTFGYFRYLALKGTICNTLSRLPMPAERILIVDDEEPIRDFVSAMLGTANYVCTQSESGKQALSLLASGQEFELMLTDLMMPGMDGIALLEASKERYPDMPVIMV